MWVGVGDFPVPTFNLVDGSFVLCKATTGDVWIIPSFRVWDYVLHVDHVSCVITMWATSVNHPFSSLKSSLGFAGGKHYQKITIPTLRLVLQNFAVPCYFPYILFYRYLFSILSSGGFVIGVCGSISVRELLRCLESLLTEVDLQWEINLMGALTFVFLF